MTNGGDSEVSRGVEPGAKRTRLVFVDCEAFGGCPALGRMTELGAVLFPLEPLRSHRIDLRPWARLGEELYRAESRAAFEALDTWLRAEVPGQPVMVSDNPAFDWQWVNDGFLVGIGRNPFGHSARRIGDFYAGLRRDFRKTQEWKRRRVTRHTHDPVDDATGNAEAFARILGGEL